MVSGWTAELSGVGELVEPMGPFASGEAQLSAHLRLAVHYVQRYVARYSHRLVDSSGTLDDMYVTMREALAVVGGAEGAGDHALEPHWLGREAAEEALLGEVARVDAALNETLAGAAAPRLPIQELRARAELSEAELTVLLAVAAPALSVDVARLYGFAWADFAVKRPTVGFLCELLADEPGDARRLMSAFGPAGRLSRCGLITLTDGEQWGGAGPLLHKMVGVPEAVESFLRGEAADLPMALRVVCRSTEAGEARAPAEVVLPEGLMAGLRGLVTRSLLRGDSGPRPWLVGARAAGRRTALAAVLGERELGLVTVDVAALPREGAAVREALVAIRRHALLSGAAVLLRFDEVADDEEALSALGGAAAGSAGELGRAAIGGHESAGDGPAADDGGPAVRPALPGAGWSGSAAGVGGGLRGGGAGVGPGGGGGDEPAHAGAGGEDLRGGGPGGPASAGAGEPAAGRGPVDARRERGAAAGGGPSAGGRGGADGDAAGVG